MDAIELVDKSDFKGDEVRLDFELHDILLSVQMSAAAGIGQKVTCVIY